MQQCISSTIFSRTKWDWHGFIQFNFTFPNPLAFTIKAIQIMYVPTDRITLYCGYYFVVTNSTVVGATDFASSGRMDD